MFLKLPTPFLIKFFTLLLLPVFISGQPYSPVPVGGDDTEEFIKSETDRLIEVIEKFITKIGYKDGSYQNKTIQIYDVLENFTGDAIIQVSSIRSGKEVKKTPVRAGDYFRTLRSLFYNKVNITFFEIERQLEVEPTPDGNYIVRGKFKQKFEGFDSLGNKIYGDITTKDLLIEVTRVSFDDGTHDFIFKVKSILVDATFEDGNGEILPFQD